MHEGKVYVHCPDASMKMLVDGFNDKVINFRFICSVMLSELEETALAISEASIKFSNSGVIAAIGNHSNFTVNKNGNIIVLTADGVNNSKFIIDTDTGIVKDLLSLDSFEYKGSISDLGSFCFHSYLTDNLKSSLLKSLGLKTINFSNVVDGFIDYVTTYWRSGLMLGANIIGFPATFAKAITISGLSSFVPICGMLLCEGDIILALRDCLPDNLWNYIGLHRNIIQTKTIPIMKSPSSYDYIEVEYNNKGQLDRSTAIYIDGYNGKRDMTVEETYNYF